MDVINLHHSGKILQDNQEQVRFELVEKMTLFHFFCIFASDQVFEVFIEEYTKRAGVLSKDSLFISIPADPALNLEQSQTTALNFESDSSSSSSDGEHKC